MLAYPAIKRLLVTGSASETLESQLVLFVCGANTCRSPMAEAIAREAVAAARAGRHVVVRSAGVSVKDAGARMTQEAIIALGELGIEVQHKTQHLTAELCRSAHVIYCMTAAHRAAVLLMAPQFADKTFCLDPEADIPDPVGQPLGVYRDFASDLQRLTRRRLLELPAFRASLSAGAVAPAPI
jgi:protein-tyrosine phosphatase